MKLNYSQLEMHLTKKLFPIYIISGEELFLKQEAIRLIRKAAKQHGFEERQRLSAEASIDSDALYPLLYSSSLLTEKILIELDFREHVPTKTAATILKDYAENPSPHHLLLIDMGKVDSKVAKAAWYQAMEKKGVTLPIWPLSREQLPQWIQARAKKYHLQMTAEAIDLFANYIEGNLMAAAQAMEKMFLLHPEKIIDGSLLKTILTDESRFTVFDFVEYLISANIPRALHILDYLKAEGKEPTLILWSITRELRLLADMAQQLKQGMSYEMIFDKHRIFARRQAAVRRFLTTFSVEESWHHLSHAAEIDKIIKGATPGDPWQALQLFCLRMV